MAYELHTVNVAEPSGDSPATDDAAVQEALEDLYRLIAEHQPLLEDANHRTGWANMGGSLVFAPGRYRLSEPLQIRAHGIRLVGCRTTLEFVEDPGGPAVSFLPATGTTTGIGGRKITVNTQYRGANYWSGMSGIEIVCEDPTWPADPVIGDAELETGDSWYHPEAVDGRPIGLLLVNCRHFTARDISVRGFAVGILLEAVSVHADGDWYQDCWACRFWLGRLVDNQLGLVIREGPAVVPAGAVLTEPTVQAPLFVGGTFEYSEEVPASWEQPQGIIGKLATGRHVYIPGTAVGKPSFHGTTFGVGPKYAFEVDAPVKTKEILLSGCRFEVAPGMEDHAPTSWVRSNGSWVTLEGCYMGESRGANIHVREEAGPHLLLNTVLRGSVQDDNEKTRTFGLQTHPTAAGLGMSFRFPDPEGRLA